MGAPGPTPSVTLEDTLGVFETLDEPDTPLTAVEVAERLACARRTAHRKLERLAERGELETKKVGARSRVWWRRSSASRPTTDGSGIPAADRLTAFVRSVVGSALIELGRDGRVDSWNVGAERLTGYPANAILGEPVSVLYRGEAVERGAPTSHVAAAREHGSSEEIEWWRRADGTVYRVAIAMTANRDDRDHLRGFIVVVHDLSGRDGHTMGGLAGEPRYELLMDHFPNGAVTLFDDDLRYIAAGGENLEKQGRSGDDLLGGRLPDVVPPGLAAVLEPEYRAAVEHGERRTFQVENDGRIYQFQALPVRDDAGEVVAGMGVSQDVTERQDYERALEESEQRYRTLVEHFPNGTVTMFDEVLRYLLVEGQAFGELELDAEDMVGHTPTEVFSAEVRDRLEPAYRAALDGEEATVEVEFEGREWEVHATPVRDHQGTVVGGMTMSQDISERKERDEALQRYKTVFDTVEDGIYILGPNFRFLEVNDAYADMTGYDREKLIGSHYSVVVGEPVSADAADLVRDMVMGASESATLQADIVTRSGDRIPGESRFTALPSDNGYQGSVGVVRDLTDRRSYERELRRYETLIEESADINAILDAEGTVQYITPSVRYVLGFDQGELVGHSAFDYIHPDDRETTMASFTSMVDGTPAPTRAEFRFRDSDGSWVWLEARGRTLADDPTIDGIAVYTRDVTERKTYERRLESRARQQAVIADLGRDALENPDLDGLFERAVRRVTQTLENDYGKVLELDCESSELLLQQGVGWRDGIVGQATVAADDNSQAGYTLRTDGPVVVSDLDRETRFSGPELLTSHGVRSGISTVIGSAMDPWGVLGTHSTRRRSFTDQDVSFVQSVANVLAEAIERQEYEAELQGVVAELAASNERLEQFAYVASHDLQEPLRMVSSYLQLLEDQYGDDLDEDAHEYLGFAVDGADRMREMIDDLLAYARVDTQGEPLEPTDCESVVDQVLTTLRVKIDETDATVEVGTLPTVAADGNQLEQVFQNLVSNAVKYRGDDPLRIKIEAVRRGRSWEFQVADNGIGMDPERTDRIFDVFKRLHTHQEYSGTGIGLALCSRIIERHGGDIWVETAPGEGSTFHFTIPALARGRPPDSHQRATVRGPGGR